MLVDIGIEGTYAPHCGADTLSITGHYQHRQWADDLNLTRTLGVAQVRYPVPWHHIEQRRGSYSWSLMDEVLGYASECNVSIVADLLHHTSFPAWLEGGFVNPDIVPSYAHFAAAFGKRYPTISSYTPFNEPTCTLDFCGQRGWWYPFASNPRDYLMMLRNTARATAEAVHALREQNPLLYVLHVDTFERHAAADVESEARVSFLNESRFLFEDLIAGRVDNDHALADYLLTNGFPDADLEWHRTHPIRIDERGGNYYPLSEEELLHGATWRAPSRHPVGFAGVVREYAARLPYPLSLTETNIQGTVHDRISWLKYMLEQTEALARDGIQLRRFTWYPLFDCAGWRCLLRGPSGDWPRDPQGIYSCDDDWRREPSALSDAYARVAGGATSADLPAYRFGAQHRETLRGLEPQMQWSWIEP